MGGIEDDEPSSKRLKLSLGESTSIANGLCLTEPPAAHIGDSMPQSLLNHGQEVVVGSRGIIKRVEFVRLISEALYSLGYEKSGAFLEAESGIPLYSSHVKLFGQLIINGNWDASIETLHLIHPLEENVLKAASLLILEQKFFELLDMGKLMDALNTLRVEIAPLCTHKSRIQKLSAFLVCPLDVAQLGSSGQAVTKTKARPYLLEELRVLLSPAAMIPERRLEHLVEQALNLQLDACMFHNSMVKEMSLFTDHHCGKSRVPSQTLHILKAHKDEVWFVQFSHNGKYLASSSSDHSAIIWEVGSDGILLKHKLSGHQTPVSSVAWSPNDEQILTCGVEETVRRWDTVSGECLQVYEKNGIGMVSCGWLPNGTCFLSGISDRSICMWDLEGKELECWRGQRTLKISDLEVTRDGKWIISICRYTSICLFNTEHKIEKFIEETSMITSFLLSRDGIFLLVNLLNQEIHLWSIDGDVRLVSTYKGLKRTRFVIRSCFGGLDDSFIASGSEDSQVYVWHRESGELVEALGGHCGSVSCVSWNPSNPHMLASASDDRTVRIWGLDPKAAAAGMARHDVECNGGVVYCNGGT